MKFQDFMYKSTPILDPTENPYDSYLTPQEFRDLEETENIYSDKIIEQS